MADLDTCLTKLYDTHAAPAFAGKRDVHDAIEPLLALGVRIQQQVAEYQAQLMAIELADGSQPLLGKVEHINQTFVRIGADAIAFVAAGRALARHFTNLDQYLPQTKVEIEGYFARVQAEADAVAAGTTPAPAVPAIPAPGPGGV